MKQSSSPKKRKGVRHDTGQLVAALVMALTVAVGGAGTTLLLATQPTGLTVEPAAQSTSEHTGTSHSQNDGQNDGSSAAHGFGSVKGAQPEQQEPVQAAEPEAQPQQPEAAAAREPEQTLPAEEPAAAEQPQPESEPELELPADALPELSETELEEENGLHRKLFQEETEALAAEDPLAPPQGYPENAAADGIGWPYEEDAVTLTPEQIEAALNAGTMTAAESRCLDRESVENCLRWLWDWLFGKEEYSGWRTEKGKTYYYDPSTHKAVTGVQSIDGKLYYFDQNGVMQDATFGIDVSKYQTGIDWDKIKASGVEFVIIRIGYRGYGSGALVLDPMFEQHFTDARNAGLRVGVYMFSQAINEEEAAEEAFACAYVLNGRKLDYPLYFDSEASGSPDGTGRADNLDTAQRTACAVAFCEEVKANGYQPGVYASTNWFKERLNLKALKGYSIWNAHYGVASSTVECDLWQGTCTARIDGYNGLLDANISYID